MCKQQCQGLGEVQGALHGFALVVKLDGDRYPDAQNLGTCAETLRICLCPSDSSSEALLGPSAKPGHWEKPVLGAAADLPLPAGTWSISSCCQELSALPENNPLLSELCHEPKTLTKVVRLHLYKQALIRTMLHKHKLSKQSSLPPMGMEPVYLSTGELADALLKSSNKGTACFFFFFSLFP